MTRIWPDHVCGSRIMALTAVAWTPLVCYDGVDGTCRGDVDASM